tara:strand:+ start:331 stop:540 length:210 start_codon:yes stop_codon:yes gene_type:complete
MKKLKGRLSWTKEDKEWLGYKRKMSVQDKDKISLSQPPWENREANAGNNLSPLPEVSVSLSKENKWTRD